MMTIAGGHLKFILVHNYTEEFTDIKAHQNYQTPKTYNTSTHYKRTKQPAPNNNNNKINFDRILFACVFIIWPVVLLNEFLRYHCRAKNEFLSMDKQRQTTLLFNYFRLIFYIRCT